MNKAGTSTPEQSIFYYIQRFFTDAQNRYQYKINNNYFEIDIYIPSIKVAIEYDGALWHKDKLDEDALKNLMLNKSGLYIIRVRDLDCPELPDFYGKIFYHGKSPKGMHTNEYIELIMHDIAKFCTDKDLANKLFNFKLTFEEYIKDSPDIMSYLYPNEVAENKSQFCGVEFWDTQTNGRLSLKNIPANDKSTIYVNFICKAGKAIHTSINILRDKLQCKKPCNECIRNFCSLIECCNEDCPIVHNYLIDYLDGKIAYSDQIYNLKNKYNKAPWIMDLFKRRMTCDNIEWNDRFDKLNLRLTLTKYDIIKSITDFDFAKKYLEIYGVAIHFDLMAFDKTEKDIKAVEDYFLAIYKKLVDLRQTDKHFSFFGWSLNFIPFTYNQWKRNKSVMSKDLQAVVINAIQKIEEKMIRNPQTPRHEFD